MSNRQSPQPQVWMWSQPQQLGQVNIDGGWNCTDSNILNFGFAHCEVLWCQQLCLKLRIRLYSAPGHLKTGQLIVDCSQKQLCIFANCDNLQFTGNI